MATIFMQREHFVSSIVAAITKAQSPESLLTIGRMIVTSKTLEVTKNHEAIFFAFTNKVEVQGLQGADLDAFAQVIPDMLEQHERVLGKGDSLYPHTVK